MRLRNVSWMLVALLALTQAAAIASTSTAQVATGVPPAQASEYEIALSQALEAHAKGEYEAARLFMERAHAIEPSARTLRGMGIVAFAQGRHRDAIVHFEASLRSTTKPLTDELRKGVEELLTHAWSQVARYEVVIDPETGDFLIDGNEPDYYAPHTIILRPGQHIITARAPARAPYELSFEARMGDHKQLHLVLAVPPPPAVREKVVYARESMESPKAHQTLRPAFYTPKARWVLLGSGAALAAAGAALWFVGYSRLQDVEDVCGKMDPKGCTEAEAKRLYESRDIGSFAVSSGVLLGAGALTLAGVGALELWQWRQRKSPIEARVGLGTLQVRGHF